MMLNLTTGRKLCLTSTILLCLTSTILLCLISTILLHLHANVKEKQRLKSVLDGLRSGMTVGQICRQRNGMVPIPVD
jgi:hypothetical protein